MIPVGVACLALALALAFAPLSEVSAQAVAQTTAKDSAQAAGKSTPAPAPATNGTLLVDTRLRYEFGDREDLDESNAVTWRVRVGYESPAWRGLSGIVEGQFNVTPDEDAYDPYPGAQGGVTKTVISDGPDARLNRAAVQYRSSMADVTAGRQRVIFDNSRFVGDVAWRQNAQMFDAVMVTMKPDKRFDVTYAYVGRAIRIFGSEADLAVQRRFEMNTRVVHATWRPIAAVSATGYTFIERITNSPADSSSTYGGFVLAQRKVGRAALGGRVEYARQTDNGENPRTAAPFDLNYVALEGKAGFAVKHGAITSITPMVGFESLGSNGARGFATPLATLHAFNGWADVFLTTPADGLHDFYFGGVVALAHAINVNTSFHHFTAARDTAYGTFGNEYDLFVTKKLNPWLTAGAKYAGYRGHSDAPAAFRSDLDRFIAQLDVLWTHPLRRH